MFKFRKKKVNNSIYLSYDEFKKLAQERSIDKNEQFLVNYYKQLSNKKGLNEKEAAHALNCIVINDAEQKAKANLMASNTNSSGSDLIGREDSMYNAANRPIDITETKYLTKFIEYISDKNHIKFIFLKVLTSSSNHKHLDLDTIAPFLYELITDFLRNSCLCKRHEIPPYNMVLSFINSIKEQLSYFNDNRNIFSLGFLVQYLPLIVSKFSKTVDDMKHENKLHEMDELLQRMYNIDEVIKEYQGDIADIITDLQFRTTKLKSDTYPERIDELNNILNDLRKQMEVLDEDLTKLENEQLCAERAAEQLRNDTLHKFGLVDREENAFNINQHIQNVMEENIDHILADNVNEHNRRDSRSKSKSQSQSKSKSHTINSAMASTSIRKPFFVRPLGFDVELDVERNELFVSDVVLDSQAYKLKVCRGWKVVMVGREDRPSVMYKILNDANEQTNDDDNALPLFITFQVNLLHK